MHLFFFCFFFGGLFVPFWIFFFFGGGWGITEVSSVSSVLKVMICDKM